MARISVVVPVYNVEDCLEWCLDSLQRQTLRDIDIVCVNDGSTDGSRVILDRCANADSRIRILDKENGGLSSARNAGIAVAEAPYVCFLDSDDRFTPDACARMVEALESADADVVTFGANPYPLEAGYQWLNDVLSPRDVVYEHFSTDILFKEKSRPFAWRMAFRTRFLWDNAIRFDETLPFGEDQVFAFAVYPRSSKTVFLSDKLYDYRVSRAGSLMDRRKKDPHAMMCEHVDIISRVYADWDQGSFPLITTSRGESLLLHFGSQMLGWAVELVLYDSLRLSDEGWVDVARRFQDVVSSYGHKGNGLQGAVAQLPPATASIVTQALKSDPSVPMRVRRRLMSSYYLQQYGVKSAVASVLRRVTGR